MKRKFVVAGVHVSDPELFESFPARVAFTGYSYIITIPRVIAEKMGLKRGDILHVCIRKITEEECRELFTDIPRMRKKNEPRKERVTCPICGKPGALYISRAKKCVKIVHRICDGFKEVTEHYISKRKYPELYRKYIGEGNGST